MSFLEGILEPIAEIFVEVFGSIFGRLLKYTGICLQMLFTGFQRPWSEFKMKSKGNNMAAWLGFFFYVGLTLAYVFFTAP